MNNDYWRRINEMNVDHVGAGWPYSRAAGTISPRKCGSPVLILQPIVRRAAQSYAALAFHLYTGAQPYQKTHPSNHFVRDFSVFVPEPCVGAYSKALRQIQPRQYEYLSQI
eukprot:3755975-Rhodomonas_salina.1